MSSDIDEALHDHPWASVGILVYGQYDEHVPKNRELWTQNLSRETQTIRRKPFVPIFRDAKYIHKIELIDNKPVWTIFITGKVTRLWGFYCPKEFVTHLDFLNENGTNVGKGCNQ